jgi:hypothetical protein
MLVVTLSCVRRLGDNPMILAFRESQIQVNFAP